MNEQVNRYRLDMNLGEFNRESNLGSSNQFASQLTFDHKKGYFISRWMLSLAFIGFLCSLVAIGFLVRYWSPCPHVRPDDNLPDDGDDDADIGPQKYAARLPTQLAPQLYQITLQPYILPELFNFDGNVTIIIKCIEPTDEIYLHFDDLIINNSSIVIKEVNENQTADDSKHYLINSLRIDLDSHFFIITLRDFLKATSTYSVYIEYKGNLNNDLGGFYRSSFKTPEGETRWLAVTQFEPTDARKAFPCFDEPAFKAQFEITIIHWSNMSAISNMPEKFKEDRGEWTMTAFEKSLNMSTYLVAFMVGPLEKITDEETQFSVWARSNLIETGRYALSIGPKILKYYEEFFGVPYPLKKTDLVALPDFSAGAMENWGLITFRENALLFDEKVPSLTTKQTITMVVAHELAHQWFGNLVTPKWWDDLWLNEGFATYVEYLGSNSVAPEWKMLDQFVVEEIQHVLEPDSLSNSHPISVEVYDPDQINEIFDWISYSKGSSVIRMLVNFLGKDTFSSGITSYLNAFSYSNADQNDLWYHLDLAQKNRSESDKTDIVDVKKVMDSWTLQTGYPVVTVMRDYNQNIAQIYQETFLLVRPNQTNAPPKPRLTWEIPITYTNQDELDWNPVTKMWLHQDQHDRIVISPEHIPGSNKWMIFNLQQSGYYRVNYDKNNWKYLIDQLHNDHTVIPATNRAQMIDDMFELARKGLVDYDLALEATSYLSKETEYIPLKAASKAFKFLDKRLRRSQIYGKWQKYVISLLSPHFDTVGWDIPVDSDNQFSQILILSWLCNYQYPKCTDKAKEMFDGWKASIAGDTENPIHPNLRSTVVCTAIASANFEDWDYTWTQYLLTTVTSDRQLLMRSLTCTKELWLLSRYMNWSFHEASGIRKQDSGHIFTYLTENNYGNDIAYQYLKENFQYIHSYIGKSYSFPNIIKTMSETMDSTYKYNEFKRWYRSVKSVVGTARRSFFQTLERIEANIEWKTIYYPVVESWLEAKVTS